MDQKIPISFPVKGLSENWAFDQQEPDTTRDLQNVRAVDPKTGRTRGAQRSGLNRFLDDQHGGGAKIQEINSVPKTQTQLSYALSSADNDDWIFDKALPNAEDCADLKIDEFGNVYALQSQTGFAKYNQDGGLQTKVMVPESDATGQQPGLSAIAVDKFQNVYVSRGLTSGSTQMADARVYAFEFQLDGTYKLAWTLDTGRYIEDLVIHEKAENKADLLLLENDDVAFDSFFKVYRDFTLAEAPVEDTTSSVTLSDTSSDDTVVYARRMAKREDGIVYITGGTEGTTDANLTYKLWKVNPYGDDPTAVIASLDSDSGGDDVTGLGFGVAVAPDNDSGDPTLYVIGNDGGATTSDTKLRRIVDNGTTFDESGTDSFSVNWTTEFDVSTVEGRRLRLATDVKGTVYVPITKDTEVIVRIHSLLGTSLATISTATGAISIATACAVPATIPDGAPADHATLGPQTTTEFVFWGSDIGAGGDTFYKTRMLGVTQSTGAFRVFKNIAIGGGNVETFEQDGSFATPTGGSGALDSSAPYVQSFVALARHDSEDKKKGRLRIYITDGKNYKKYDPEDDEVTNWESTSQGVIPPRCRLCELWQGRAVLARDPENPAAWHMSAIGNPEDWDVNPQNVSAAQAISGATAQAGDAPDVVNTLIPWDDDVLLFGGDRSIYAMRGNPMLGGQFDEISTEVGMAFGRPWAREPGGQTVYFASQFGGIYALSRGGTPVRLTRDRIERRMQDNTNWQAYYLRLVWNYRDEGLHVFQLPHAAGGAIVKHWFWDRKNDAWFEDRFGTSGDTNKQPTAVFMMDGDRQNDRVLVMGCEDGRIRAWDEDSPNDDYDTSTAVGSGGGDNLAIDSYVTIGPLQPRSTELETQFTGFTTWLDHSQDGVNYSFFVDDEPSDALNHAAKVTGSLSPGRNPTRLVRFRGEVAYLRLRNANAGQRWAFEKASIGYAPAGMKRAR